MNNESTILLAAEFAVRAHRKQERKYTGEPYMVHPLSVARMVRDAGGSTDMVIAAILHDVIEDCPWVKPGEIITLFGSHVGQLVMQLTKVSRPEDGNRAARMVIELAHFAGASAEAQTIKLADLIDNTRTIMLHDKGFAVIYMTEKRDLLRYLTQGERGLYAQARRQLDEFFDSKVKNGNPA